MVAVVNNKRAIPDVWAFSVSCTNGGALWAAIRVIALLNGGALWAAIRVIAL